MYSPAYNQVEDRAQQLELMRGNNFAILVTGAGGELQASHLVCLVEERGDAVAIVGHMAKSNPQWQSFFDDDVLLIFHGPHAYVSPRWYEQKERVPTWNYAALHVYGKVRVIDAGDTKHAVMRRLVAVQDPAWLAEFDALRPEYLGSMLDGIVAFEVQVSRLETRWKLSQNRGRREQERIAAALENSADSAGRATAELTRRHMVENE
ncbi:MAG: FMN-binding negative transcriptional regulator [Betaproteobacteria bacterium]|nr:FMN-binding negative transcriptional regulator [Betaproteobacteria bacterium]